MSDFVSSNVRQGSYGPSYLTSMENAELLDRGIYQKVFKQYGKLYGMHDILMMAGNEISVPAQNQKVVEEYAPKWPIKLGAAIATGAAGADITVVIDSSSLVSNVHHARVGFSVKIPAEKGPAGNKKDMIYRIQSLGTTNVANDTLTCTPFLADGTYTQAQISTQLEAGEYIDVSGYSSFSRGEGQPAGTFDFPVTRTYTSGIIKETKGFDGGVLSQEGEIAEFNGTRWLLSRESFDAEFRLKDQLDDALTFSEPNDNATDLTTSSTMSTQAQATRSTRGLVSWLDDAGQNVSFVDTPDLSVFDDVIDSLMTQGVYTNSVTVFCSPWFFRKIQPELKDFVREYSGGTDMMDNLQSKVGATIYVYNVGGVDFYLHPVATWGNPSDAGLIINDSAVYAAGTMAIAVPNTKVTVGKWGEEANVTIPNLWLGYVNFNGENRKFMMGRYLGVNGVYSTDLVATDLDGYKLYWAREFMLGGAEWNKMAIIRKQIV